MFFVSIFSLNFIDYEITPEIINEPEIFIGDGKRTINILGERFKLGINKKIIRFVINLKNEDILHRYYNSILPQINEEYNLIEINETDVTLKLISYKTIKIKDFYEYIDDPLDSEFEFIYMKNYKSVMKNYDNKKIDILISKLVNDATCLSEYIEKEENKDLAWKLILSLKTIDLLSCELETCVFKLDNSKKRLVEIIKK